MNELHESSRAFDEALEQRVIVYHMKSKGTICFDGFLAAALFWQIYGDEAEYLPTTYSDVWPLEKFANKQTIFVDFSYPVGYMDEIAAVAKSLLVLDHHETALGLTPKPYAIIDQTACGSLLAWRHLHKDKPAPDFVKLVDDGDRFAGQYQETLLFQSALSTVDKDFSEWCELLDMKIGTFEFEMFLKNGEGVQRLNAMRTAELVADSFPITLCGVTGLAVNSNKFYSSLVGNALALKSGTFGAVFFQKNRSEIEVSLRRLDPAINVEAIARQFGGGGHKGAAAFVVSTDKFQTLLESNSICTKIAQVTDTLYSTSPHWSPDCGAVAARLYQALAGRIDSATVVNVSKTPLPHPSWLKCAIANIARGIGFPQIDHCKKWYHAILPYTVNALAPVESPSTDTVKKAYVATLALRRYEITAEVCVPYTGVTVSRSVLVRG